MPANVFVNERASVTAGLAKDVEAVNQYAPVMYAPTANGTADGRECTTPQMTASRPNVAMNSLKSWGEPERMCSEASKMSRPNIACAEATPASAPRIGAAM